MEVDGIEAQQRSGDNNFDNESAKPINDQVITESNIPRERVPELIRRLHQVLSLYETISLVKTMPRKKQRPSQDANGSDLQILTQPIELTLSPAAFCNGANIDNPLRQLTILVEPLTSIFDLEKLVLCIFKIVHPFYVAFCQR